MQLGAIQALCNAVGGGCHIFRKKCYIGVRYNVITVMRGWAGVHFPENKCYVTLEWPLMQVRYLFALLHR